MSNELQRGNPSRQLTDPAAIEQRSEESEPIWAKPCLGSLLTSDHMIAEADLFEYGWPSPLPERPSGLVDHIPAWAEKLVALTSPDASGNGEADHDEEPPDGAAWDEMRTHLDSGAVLRAQVTGNNKGGLLVRVGELQGFVPSSQLVCFPRHLGDHEREAFLSAQLDSELEVRVIELDRDRNRLVLSERACILPRENGDALLDLLSEGDTCEGLISNLCTFGAFVDLGGLDGLIHISEISWQRINHPGDVLRIGQRVRVQVLSVDKPSRRIALSLKRLHTDPWATIEQRFQVGQVVPGVVTNLVEFGAFARIDEGLEGLIHLTELSDDQIEDPRDVVLPGQELDLYILRIDGPNHRLGLSLKRAQNGESDDGPEATP